MRQSDSMIDFLILTLAQLITMTVSFSTGDIEVTIPHPCLHMSTLARPRSMRHVHSFRSPIPTSLLLHLCIPTIQAPFCSSGIVLHHSIGMKFNGSRHQSHMSSVQHWRVVHTVHVTVYICEGDAEIFFYWWFPWKKKNKNSLHKCACTIGLSQMNYMYNINMHVQVLSTKYWMIPSWQRFL